MAKQRIAPQVFSKGLSSIDMTKSDERVVARRQTADAVKSLFTGVHSELTAEILLDQIIRNIDQFGLTADEIGMPTDFVDRFADALRSAVVRDTKRSVRALIDGVYSELTAGIAFKHIMKAVSDYKLSQDEIGMTEDFPVLMAEGLRKSVVKDSQRSVDGLLRGIHCDGSQNFLLKTLAEREVRYGLSRDELGM